MIAASIRFSLVSEPARERHRAFGPRDHASASPRYAETSAIALVASARSMLSGQALEHSIERAAASSASVRRPRHVR